jgi:O-antigen/teichoic acid export membrane protein
MAMAVAAAVGLSALLIVPIVAALAVLAGPIMSVVFGARYPAAAQPLPLLALGMGLYGFYVVLESTMWALGRPHLDAIATGAGMLVTVGLTLVLVPGAGLTGAALAFAAGAALKLAVLGAVTAWGIFLRGGTRLGHFDEETQAEAPTLMP